MTELTILKGKDPQEAAQVLAALASSLLPQPGVAEISRPPVLASNVVQSALKEIKQLLRVPESDFSRDTQSKIYAFLSSEISRVALSSTSENSIKDRLGNKGQLRPNQYEIVIDDASMSAIQALGNKRVHVIEAIKHPDAVVHLATTYTDKDDIRPTISIKLVTGKRPEEDFALLIISRREGQIQQLGIAFRLYRSDVESFESEDPLHALRAFVQAYGLTFQIGNVVSKYLENEVIGVSHSIKESLLSGKHIHPIEGRKGSYYLPFFAGTESPVQTPHAEATFRVFLAFVIDISRYAETMRRHRLQLTPQEPWKFHTI